ncbi:hypothetical protein QVD17_15365 [Tagetes erecta]|uniref:Uncharacterized protein n=1 Tax=Tagetes erecta TaxID=13708 RepID=A0AAD8KUS3_TARER|nr:hypothetical protein QVD17_15365 [Tagetes erecta]
MSENQTCQNPLRNSCIKIRKPVFGRFRHADPLVSSKPRVSHTIPVANVTPDVYVPPADAKLGKNVRFSTKNATKNDRYSGGKELVDQKTFGDSKFDSFIHHTKVKMSAPSNVGAVKTVNRHDTLHEKVSNFIDRAKLKFRATSSVGAHGKSVSHK